MTDEVHEDVANLSAVDVAVLRQELDLLQILHHRNKNQHRAATWYKHLKVLKSSLNRMLLTATALAAVNGNTAKTKKTFREYSEFKTQYTLAVQAFLARHHSIYIGFTQIIGTGQYVALGMILLGILARSWHIVRSLVSVSDSASETEAVNLGEEEGTDTMDAADVGVVLDRASLVKIDSPNVHEASARLKTKRKLDDSHAALATKRTGSVSDVAGGTKGNEKITKNKKKKRMNVTDEIDSIFG